MSTWLAVALTIGATLLVLPTGIPVWKGVIYAVAYLTIGVRIAYRAIRR